MNIVPFNQQQAKDYRAFMQQAARSFIDKHAAEHLDDDGLFERTVCYLVNNLEVPAFMAGRLVLLATSDRRSGLQSPLPPQLLPHRFLAAPAAP
ncbi:hypothetical protein [Pseudomonas denitrificans (nom. rej.)]|uniref:Uncharacterized protein n=1 Tax=Pseudomonas denitrificans TaxID=43306 RepID=A0A9X7N318_PSEDE|nr:hypothetical protein [Pseudomonas denitrificans (nom. rej.)]QEY74113.1 hypothetical protein F1C79_22285 [Pseudomonas denitrificans (nom. rej.)]